MGAIINCCKGSLSMGWEAHLLTAEHLEAERRTEEMMRAAKEEHEKMLLGEKEQEARL